MEETDRASFSDMLNELLMTARLGVFNFLNEVMVLTFLVLFATLYPFMECARGDSDHLRRSYKCVALLDGNKYTFASTFVEFGRWHLVIMSCAYWLRDAKLPSSVPPGEKISPKPMGTSG